LANVEFFDFRSADAILGKVRILEKSVTIDFVRISAIPFIFAIVTHSKESVGFLKTTFCCEAS
jgi:hypothetical protein